VGALVGALIGVAAGSSLLVSLAITAWCVRRELRRRRRAAAGTAAAARPRGRAYPTDDSFRPSYYKHHSYASGGSAAAAAAAAVGWRTVLRDWFLDAGSAHSVTVWEDRSRQPGPSGARTHSGGMGVAGSVVGGGRTSEDMSPYQAAGPSGPRKNAPPGGNLFEAKRSRPPGAWGGWLPCWRRQGAWPT
jgi:hypothetical protein